MGYNIKKRYRYRPLSHVEVGKSGFGPAQLLEATNEGADIADIYYNAFLK